MMRVAKIFMDDLKEEQWLNDMANKGWYFKKLRFPYYTFEQGEPGQYTYRLEMLSGLGSKTDLDDYLEFVESTGIEVVQKRFNWAYFRQHTSKGPFELYSDAQSKLSYVQRMYGLFLVLIVINVMSAVANAAESGTGAFAHVNDFMSGLSTGVVAALIIPFIKIAKRKRNIKKEHELFEQ